MARKSKPPKPSIIQKTPEKAQEEPPQKPAVSRKTLIELVARPLGFLTLAAFSSPISQATLAPVFGAIPSAVNHQQAIIATPLLAFLLRYLYKSLLPDRVAQCLAVWAFWIPVLQVYLFRFSAALGPQAGPGVIGFLSCHTIIIPAVYAAAEAAEVLNLKRRFGPYLGALFPMVVGMFHFRSFETSFQAALPQLMMWSRVFTPVKMQLIVATTLSYLAPSKFSLLALPALIHTFLANPHFDSTRTLDVLNGTLHTHNWTILDRRWSNTGYISVLESLDMQYRVMRCDHSLLGGEWLLTNERREKEGWKVDEPIYSVFEMLEAVRLIELEPVVPDSEAHALVIGLGIGTTPKAFLAHGTNTTIVELDPVVHEYASTYFGLPPNHHAVIHDAVFWVDQTAVTGATKFDYIVHDVFTGGAEPLSLFTVAFLKNIRSLLKPNGVIALNYAGDLTMPLTTKVLNTIDLIFEGQCKIYRDTPSESNAADDKAAINEDFTNIIVFCRNQRGSIRFRKPTKADFLGSKSREHYMLPDPKFEIPFPLQGSPDRPHLLQQQVLRQGDESKWSGQQAESAIKHWYVMRKVVPDAVWELW